MKDRIFEKDEMTLDEVNQEWGRDELLAQRSIFYLKDVVDILLLDPARVKKHANELKKKNISAWRVMGVRKMWTHWIVRMSIFSSYYTEHLQSGVRKIDPSWDGNTLLKQKGIFPLTSVCKLIPFSAHQLRYRAKKNPNAAKEFGIWKDEDSKTFVVDMEPFSIWIQGLWGGKFN